ncbi:alpha/beta-hydrolase family protein [uncultured Gordonia sp.]|uniref:alpha/beta-hydrolase family protein n=1 Tax=uncultured Gordonia sp. TaxID=198437 RepID=UPI00259109D0|nr:alpha/beta-hydrolase family protein [uncultured Gordonia sp.]
MTSAVDTVAPNRRALGRRALVRRALGRLSPPGSLTVVGGLIGALIALWPGSLPRDVVTAAVLTGVCVAVMTAVGRALGSARPERLITSWAVAALAVAVLMAGSIANTLWQNILRSDIGIAGVGPAYPAATAAAGCAGFVAVAWFGRRAAMAATAALATVVLFSTPATSAAASIDATPTAADIDRTATVLTDTWVREGGLRRGAVVIAVPTGSGWVDPQATTAMRARLHDDVEFLSLPYASASSWRVFVSDRGSAATATVALLRHVLDARDSLPPGVARPRVYLYGQSLGALGADRAREWANTRHPGAVAGTVLAGVPADTVDPRGGGSSRIVFANSSDPVTRWSTAAVWRPPTRPAQTRIVGARMHTPPWLPVVSFVQTSVDLLGALDGPAGTGHRYGPEQGALP